MNHPQHKVSTVEHHEWVIGEEGTPTTAKDFYDGIYLARNQMEKLGVILSFDDAFFVKAGDGGQVILFVDIVKKETS